MAAGASRNARAPATMPSSTPETVSPAMPDGTNAGPFPINQTATADAMKVTAFNSIAVAGVETTSTRAPSAGPATIAAWPTAARRALARWSSGPGTSRAVLTATHGGTAVPAAVAAAAITGARTIGSPAAATAASATMSATRTRSAPIINLRRSCRSAMTPPSGPRRTMGRTRAAVVSATHVPECVRSNTSASRATL